MGKGGRQGLGSKLRGIAGDTENSRIIDWKEGDKVMTTTFISTNECKKVRLPGAAGEVAEILNKDLCGAKNVLGMLRWLRAGERLDAEPRPGVHQLIYLMQGEGVITLEKKDYAVAKGAGVYLGLAEGAGIRQTGAAPLKLFHLVVPKAGN